MTRASPGITHIVQTVEACSEVEVGLLNVLGARLLKSYTIANPMREGMLIGLLHGRRMEIVFITFQSETCDAHHRIQDWRCPLRIQFR